MESFVTNLFTDYASGDYPQSTDNYLVQDTYPRIKKTGISNDSANDIWWHYPTFRLGSYKQITNNIRYPNNPDVGRCTPASVCGSLYHERKQPHSNYVTSLPPINPMDGTRVGYFTTNSNLLPFYTNTVNILY